MTLEFLLEPRARQHVRGSGALHDGAVRRGLTAHEERDANRAVVSDNRDFRRCAVFEHVEEGDDDVGRKIDVTQRVARLVQSFTERQRYELQVREQSLAFWLRQRIQNVILLWVGYSRHLRVPMTRDAMPQSKPFAGAGVL